jgi:hypothetical protein
MAHLVLHPPWQEMRAKGGQRNRGRSAVTITQWLTSHPTTMSRPPCASVAWSHARVCESVRFWRFMLGSRGGRGGVTVSVPARPPLVPVSGSKGSAWVSKYIRAVHVAPHLHATTITTRTVSSRVLSLHACKDS